MPEILLCNRQFGLDSIESQCGVAASEITGFGCTTNPTSLLPYQPYLLGPAPSYYDRQVMTQLGAGGNVQNLTDLSPSFGADNTLALADITAKLQEYQIGLMGTTTSVYAQRVQGFGLAVKKYQEALLEYRNAIKAGPAIRATARQKGLYGLSTDASPVSPRTGGREFRVKGQARHTAEQSRPGHQHGPQQS